MGHGHDDVLGARHQVHGAAHALDQLARDHPRGDIALHVYLERTQHGQVDMAATNHGERLRRVEDRGTPADGDGLLAGVDHVGVEGAFGGELAHAEQAVFRLQHHIHVSGYIVGHQGRNADTQVDVVAVLQFTGDALRHLFAGQCHGQDLFVVLVEAAQALTVRFSIRFSKVPTITRST